MILEAIFNGEIYPAETVVPKSEKFREAGQAIADIMRYFEQTLIAINHITNDTLMQYSEFHHFPLQETLFPLEFIQ